MPPVPPSTWRTRTQSASCTTTGPNSSHLSRSAKITRSVARLSSAKSSSWCHRNFYRAMLCIRGTSHGPVSVCLSLSVCVCVCLSQVGVLLKRLNVGSHKRHHTIAQGLIVFWCQRSMRNSTWIKCQMQVGSMSVERRQWSAVYGARVNWAPCR